MTWFKQTLPWMYYFLKSDKATYLNIVVALTISGLFVYLVWIILERGVLAKKIKQANTNFIAGVNSGMRSQKLNFLNYESIEKFISYTGLGYQFGKWFDPMVFLGVCILLALLGFFVGFSINPLAQIPLGIVGFFTMVFVGTLNNVQDNSQILEDIKGVYDTLRIQTKAGVFLTSAIQECYLVVKNKRLKQALIELANDLLVKNDVESAAAEFQGKFRNQYIDQMAVIIKQSQEQGRAAQMFDDIQGQIDDIQAAINLKEKAKIKNQITICQVFVYVQILQVVVFCVVGTLKGDLGF